MAQSRVYGVNACKVFYKTKPDRIFRAFFTKDRAPLFSDLMKEMAKKKKVYRIVTMEELEKISQTRHHEGVCLNVDLEPAIKLEKWFKQESKTTRSLLLGLDNIGNPHNLGAIMRTAAHFGVNGIATVDAKAMQSGAAKRTAEGGAEYVQIVECESIKELILKAKKENYSIVTTSSHRGTSLYKVKFPEKCLLVFGEEGFGLSADILKTGDISLQIPGTQNVESLNVSASIAVILSEVWRQKKD